MRLHGAELVLLDLMLPGKNGLDVCKALRLQSQAWFAMPAAETSASRP